MISKQKIKSTLKVGITGSIGAGKTTVCKEILGYNIPIWSADEVVHKLYEKPNKGYEIIRNIAPTTITSERVDRERLSEFLLKNNMKLGMLENALNPLLEADRNRFIKNNKKKAIVVFEIPLLFEKGADAWLDKVIVVTVSSKTQRERVLSRKDMTEKKFNFLISRRLKTDISIEKADYLIDTDNSLTNTKAQIKNLVYELRKCQECGN